MGRNVMRPSLMWHAARAKFAPRGVRIYRTGGPDAPPWFIWNRYPPVTIGFAVRVAPRHLLSIVWRKA